MRAYERNGVTVDQCVDCRGIYLDRGELERLTVAETSYYDSAPRPAEPVPARYAGGYRDSRDGHHGRRKRGGFLSELFD